MGRIQHEIPPVYDARSEILILGSFPSVKSREGQFFYHHPQNRFWKVLAVLCGTCSCSGNLCQGYVPDTIDAKRIFLLEHKIAVWDVIGSCEIQGSSDSSIRNVEPNDLSEILQTAQIQKIGCNGSTSFSLYEKYLKEKTRMEAEKLPSTSPANAAWSVERLAGRWREVLFCGWPGAGGRCCSAVYETSEQVR